MDKSAAKLPDRTSPDRLAALFVDQSASCLLLLLDPFGQVVSCNAGGKGPGPLAASRVIGSSHTIFYPPDEVAEGRPQSDLDEAVRTGALDRDAWRVRGDGTEYLARLSITPLHHEGEVVGFGVVSRDITDEAASRASAESREQHLQSILETVPDAMIVIDEAGLITSFSAAAERLFGFREAELLGENISCLMPEPDATRHDSYVRHYLDTGERRIIGIGRVVRGRKRDGTIFPMELSVGEAGEDGQRVFTGFVRDLTAKEQDELKLKELQAELVHVSRLSAMGTMASTLAHELNQPLAAVALYLETARDILEDASTEPLLTLRGVMGEAAEETLRVGSIVRRLRDFVSRGEVDKSLEDLPTLIEQAAQLALVGARERGVRGIFDFDPRATPVLVDKVQIQQVLVNLMRNAVEAMASTAVRDLTVSSTLRSDGFVEVMVADTGPGIAEEVRSRLFEAFVSTKETGMGLGLSICRTIVEAHGGRIWIEDRAGSGTCFHFTLIHAQAEQ